MGSAVFDAMFNSTLATRDDEVVLPDVEPSSFLALLRFLYSDEVQVRSKSLLETRRQTRSAEIGACRSAPRR